MRNRRLRHGSDSSQQPMGLSMARVRTQGKVLDGDKPVPVTGSTPLVNRLRSSESSMKRR